MTAIIAAVGIYAALVLVIYEVALVRDLRRAAREKHEPPAA